MKTDAGQSSCKREQRAAFTLLELLAACSVTLLILTITLRVFSAATDLWRHSETRAETYREARAALDIMARDLRMTSPAPGAPMLRLAYDPETSQEDRVNEEVYAMAALPNAGKGSLCAVGYRCVWNEETKCYVLKRLFRNSNDIFNGFKKAGGVDFSTLYSRADALTNPDREEEAARYIWDLTFRPCENGEVATAYPDKTYSEDLPLWIEIRFKALGPAAAAKLNTLPVTRETWTNPEDPLFKRLIHPFQQQFSMRVRLYAASPQ